MSYEKQTWYDDPSGGTPLTADKMNHIEDGIEELDQFRTSIDPIKIRTRKGIQFNQSGQQPITSLSGFTDIDNDLIISVIPSIAGASSSSLQAKALWNTLDGNNDLQIVTGVSQSVYVNVTVIYLVS